VQLHADSECACITAIHLLCAATTQKDIVNTFVDLHCAQHVLNVLDVLVRSCVKTMHLVRNAVAVPLVGDRVGLRSQAYASIAMCCLLCCQVRGSIPLLWSQIPNIKYKPTTRLLTSGSPTSAAFDAHFDALLAKYKVGDSCCGQLQRIGSCAPGRSLYAQQCSV
jgi:hypothetical protein